MAMTASGILRQAPRLEFASAFGAPDTSRWIATIIFGPVEPDSDVGLNAGCKIAPIPPD
jgi:hypothetical protein